MRRFQIFVTFVAVACSALLFQNCGEFQSIDSVKNLSSSGDPGSNDNLSLTNARTAAKAVLNVRCVACHDANSAFSTFKSAGNLQLMIDEGYVIPGSPETSALIDRIDDGSMPPGSPLSNTDRQKLVDWILAEGDTGSDDSNPPSVMITSSPPASSTSNSATFQFMASDQESGVDRTECQLDTGVWAGCTSPKMYTSLGNGTHTFKVRAIDKAGLVSTEASHTWTIAVTGGTGDQTPPMITVTSPAASATVSGMVTITANVTDNVAVAGVQFRINSTNLGAPDTTVPYSAVWNTTSVANGQHTITVLATDTSNNVSQTPITVNVNNATSNPLGPATFSNINQKILQPKCLSCHGNSGGYSYATYSLTLQSVTSGSPQQSPLYTSTQTGRMPVGNTKLTANELKLIFDWITAGAPNN